MPPAFLPGQSIPMTGFFTKAGFLRQQPAPELERRLGYAQGRLVNGWWLLFLEQMPTPNDFEFMGYSYMSGGMAQGHVRPGPTAEQHLKAGKFDVFGMKRRTILQTFRLSGPDRLAKVVPVADQSGAMPYPSGTGVPQWKLIQPLKFRVVGEIGPGRIYSGDYS
ncbi:hypothetical protein [Bradyrhizobium sp. AUGA SZCCT0182]|uniref:hypothetical protein n=1 Tax=Bradyrhizobium sp. AUGA SZCCT0182 TaxID=2807667 RepID=UPI001BA6843E|nr:hypothetical protein [Bradyrhizobium sp. AUGA SZCCT0182]MBR1232076.1 hypothetical protein [Bradyrhizobium sp. AUGA SZCCT0182]